MLGKQLNGSVGFYRWIYAVLTGLAIFLSFNYQARMPVEVIWSDAEGYHMYLPCALVYGNFDDYPVKTTEEIKHYPGTQKYFTKFTYGVALMQGPFFLGTMAYGAITNSQDAPNDGIYESGVLIAGFVYGWLGMLALVIFLLRRFPKWIVVVTTAFIFFGTNLFYYWIVEAGSSHVYSFFLLANMLLLTDRLEGFKRWWQWCLLGLVLGLLTLVRPTNLIAGLLIVFLNVHNRDQLITRLRFLWGNWKWLGVMAFIGIICWVPQVIYWYHISGNWIGWSYQGEGFTNWNSPKLIQVLTSEFNGLFIYVPLAAIAVIGSVAMTLKNRAQGWLYLGLFGLISYIFASWHYWSFGLSFGHRAYVEWYAVLALPIAFLLNASFRWRKWLGLVVLLAGGLCVYYTLELTYVYRTVSGWGDHDSWSFQVLWDIIDREVF